MKLWCWWGSGLNDYDMFKNIYIYILKRDILEKIVLWRENKFIKMYIKEKLKRDFVDLFIIFFKNGKLNSFMYLRKHLVICQSFFVTLSYAFKKTFSFMSIIFGYSSLCI